MSNFICCSLCFNNLNDELEDAGNIWLDICGIKERGYDYIRICAEAENSPFLSLLEAHGGIITTERDDGVCINITVPSSKYLGTTIYCFNKGEHGSDKNLQQMQETEDSPS